MKRAKEKSYTMKQFVPVGMLLAFCGVVLGLVAGSIGDASDGLAYEELAGEYDALQVLCVESVQNVSDEWEREYEDLREQHNALVAEHNLLRQQGLALVDYTEALSNDYNECLQRVGEQQVLESNLELLLRLAPLLI